MPKSLSYTPPGRLLEAGSSEPVRKRHVLYIPGYDPEAKTRSRSLFVRELIRYGRRFGLSERTISPVEEIPDLPGLRWHIASGRDDWAVQTTYEVLRWDDIVATDFRRPLTLSIAPLLLGNLLSLAEGLTFRLFRLNWIFACVTIYPAVMVLLLGVAAGGLGALAGWGLAANAGLHPLLASLVGAAVAAVVLRLAGPFFDRWYVWHLLRDWLFNWQHGRGARSDYEGRVGRFAAHLSAVAASSDADEILVIGHSSGAGMAVETVARALASDPGLGRHGPEIALLTIGTSLPVPAMNRRATAIRAAVTMLILAKDVVWVEYQAPQDWLNAAGFNPIETLSLPVDGADCINPIIRSARFREITSEATYRTMLKSPFRLHFQFMMANDKPGEYDLVMMVVGPMRLLHRVRDPEAAKALIAPQPGAAA